MTGRQMPDESKEEDYLDECKAQHCWNTVRDRVSSWYGPMFWIYDQNIAGNIGIF